MLNIKFNKPSYFNNRYVVYLDSDNQFTFKNKRQAEDFIRRVARESDKTLLLITESLNDLECFYRLYSLLDADYKFKHLVENSITYINNRINWISEHSGSVNHDAILFHSLLTCLSELQTGFTLVEEKALQHKDTLTRKRCALKVDILRMYQDQIAIIKVKPQALKIKYAKK